MTDTNTPSETCAQELEKWLEESKPAETAVKFVNTIVSNMLEFTSPDTGEGIPDFKEHKIRLQIEDPDDDSITILKNLVHMLRNRDTFRNADLEKQTQNTLIQLRQGLVEARDAIGLGKDPHTILEKYRKYKEPPEQSNIQKVSEEFDVNDVVRQRNNDAQTRILNQEVSSSTDFREKNRKENNGWCCPNAEFRQSQDNSKPPFCEEVFVRGKEGELARGYLNMYIPWVVGALSFGFNILVALFPRIQYCLYGSEIPKTSKILLATLSFSYAAIILSANRVFNCCNGCVSSVKKPQFNYRSTNFAASLSSATVTVVILDATKPLQIIFAFVFGLTSVVFTRLAERANDLESPPLPA